MKKLVLLGLALSLAMGVQAAKPAAKPVAKPVPKAAAEPSATPEVKTTDAPEVSDPDLKEAVPAMRQGTEEPLGGFNEPGMKGRSAVSFSWGMGSFFVDDMIGWRYWMKDGFALEAGLGGSYSSYNGGEFSSSLAQELGLRWALTSTHEPAFLFLEVKASARQSRSYVESQSLNPTFTQYSINETVGQDYALCPRFGAEIFWPGSRRASMDVSGGVLASWTRLQSAIIHKSTDPLAGSNSRLETSSESFKLASNYANLLMAINLYY